MGLPERPSNIDELEEQIASGRLRESHDLEFKREFPDNRALAKQIAGLAADGGVLMVGVEETESGFQVRPIDCNGARERVEHIARDRPKPSVDVESYILDAEDSGFGVLWVVIPPSPHLLHQVDGTYYGRGDTETRRMDDAEVAERMASRSNRKGPIGQALDDALQRKRTFRPALRSHLHRGATVRRGGGGVLPEHE